MSNFTGLDIINGGLSRHQKTTLISGSSTSIEGYEKDLLNHLNSVLLKFYNTQSVEDILELTIEADKIEYDLSEEATDIDPEFIKDQVVDDEGGYIEKTTREKYIRHLTSEYAGSQAYWFIKNDFVNDERKSYFVTVPQLEEDTILYLPYRKQFVSPITHLTVEDNIDLPYRYFDYLCDLMAGSIATPDEKMYWESKAQSTISRLNSLENINKLPDRIEPDRAFKNFLRSGF